MTQDKADAAAADNMELQVSEQNSTPEEELKKPEEELIKPEEEVKKPVEAVKKPVARCPRQGRRGKKGKKQTPAVKKWGAGDKRRGQKDKRRGCEESKEGVTVKRMWSGGKRQYCVFCRRPQVKIARHLLRKHKDEPEVVAASTLPTGSKQRHLLLEHLRCRGNYLHNIEVIRQGSGEIIPCRQPSEEVDARNYLPCPLCLGFFLRSDLWKHQACCRKKLASDSISIIEKPFEDISDATSDITGKSACDVADDGTSTSMADSSCDPPRDTVTGNPTGTFETGSKRAMTEEVGEDQNETSDFSAERPRKRSRVQAAASRLLPISGGASESCSEVLHRMNHDHISHEVKSDWLICKYGNKLMENQDGGQKRYDYVSQKLRDLGRFLLAAKSLDSSIQTLLDVLAPGNLSLALSAARKASGYRWIRPPLAVKTTLKTVCEIAIGESLQDGDWEAAAQTTDFYHMLGRDWDNLGLMEPDLDPDSVPPEGRAKLKKRFTQSWNKKAGQRVKPRPQVLSKTNSRPVTSMMSPESTLQAPVSVPMAPRKVHRRPWSTAEKEAVWRQLGVHVLVQTVPGKEVCQRCLDMEPVLRGRHWKDIKNQVHNQIQSQKKQQFHAQMDLQENQGQQNQGPQNQGPQNQGQQNHAQQNQEQQHQEQQHQEQQHQEQQNQIQQNQIQQNQGQRDQISNQKKQHQHYQAQMDQQGKDHIQNQKKQQYHVQMDQHSQDHTQNQKKQQYHIQMDHQEQDHNQNQKKQQYHVQMEQQDHLQALKKQPCHIRLDHQDHVPVLKKQLYQMDQQTQALQATMERDTSLLTGPYGPDGPHRAPGLSLVERDPIICPYPLQQRAPGPHMEQLLPRTEWTDESLVQNYPVSRPLARNLLQDAPPGGLPPNPHPGHGHF
ncbi:uncharacterized protein LOC131455827 [Solea solea]|uniref:uncharacterized protein LOC131455827 n=1 Tax=Solea solea TaxID=90069 RepID=UPI00272B8451|nr:uncharacterized protein LOC131455827 [Solea solea]XP_058479629.1 uncharacterized protein LOC131455827 [Solea solea]